MDQNIELKLRIKYGLPAEPTSDQIRHWANEVDQLVAIGIDLEAAGKKAAEQVFPGAGTYVLKSEADTVEALLNEAKKK